MGHPNVRLIDLPDELLLMIFNKLNNIQVLYSLMDVNRQLDRIVCDPIFTDCLTLVRFSLENIVYPLSNTIFDRFCSQILPKINHNVKCLKVELSSMERVLTGEYPNLNELYIFKIEEETMRRLFLHENRFNTILKNQISKLTITIIQNRMKSPSKNSSTNVLTYIFSIFKNLRYLKIDGLDLPWYVTQLSFENRSPPFSSSILMDLDTNVRSFDDCLYLLDGRFNQLRKLHVDIFMVMSPTARVDNKEILPNLRCLSLKCHMEMDFYDELLLPLLCRMINLKELCLDIIVDRYKRFIDGNDLTKISNCLLKLNTFKFNIQSMISFKDQIDFRSNEEIEQTLVNFKDNPVISCVDYFLKKRIGQCHICSYPYISIHYKNITNNFPGGLFKCVRQVSLYDERPFEYEFFFRLTQSFPFMKKLSVNNRKAQKKKEYQKSKDDEKDFSMIEYNHLTEIELIDIHKDYVQLFLDHTKTSLPNNVFLDVDYYPLRKVTHNFQRDVMRVNCAKVRKLSIGDPAKISNKLKAFFPNARVF